MSLGPVRQQPLPSLGEVIDFMRLIWAVDHGLQSRSRQMEATLGVTGPQRLIVKVLGRFPGLTAGQLAEILAVHPSTVTGLLNRLEAKKLIERRKDSHDRRRSFLGLTAAGIAIDRAKAGTIEDAVDRVMRTLPRAKRDAAAEVLRALADSLALERAGELDQPGAQPRTPSSRRSSSAPSTWSSSHRT